MSLYFHTECWVRNIYMITFQQVFKKLKKCGQICCMLSHLICLIISFIWALIMWYLNLCHRLYLTFVPVAFLCVCSCKCIYLLVFSARRGVAGGAGGAGTLTAVAGPGGGPSGGGVAAGSKEPRRCLPAVRAGEQLGGSGGGSQQRGGTKSAGLNQCSRSTG